MDIHLFAHRFIPTGVKERKKGRGILAAQPTWTLSPTSEVRSERRMRHSTCQYSRLTKSTNTGTFVPIEGKMTQLPPKCQQSLEFIRRFIQEKGYGPTIRDILQGRHISSISSVQHDLKMLEREGYISRDYGIRRSITLTDRARTAGKVPLLGYIAAGQPIPVPQSDTWHEEPLETLELPADMASDKGNVYALEVQGLSMIDAFIDDGDIVIMQATNTVMDGEMAAVWLKAEQEVTLKKVYRERNRIRLQPANSQMKPTYHNPENVEVQGRVIGVIRRLTKST
jgi:repressor LexA